MQMNMERASENLRVLGDNFALCLAELGRNLDVTTPVMNGLLAYQVLGLKGAHPWLDASVELILNKLGEAVGVPPEQVMSVLFAEAAGVQS